MAKTALKLSFPVMVGYIVLGLGFGILFSATLGLGPLWAFLMSLFVYTGALQYLSVGLFASGAGLLTIALNSFAVSARHIFYGISMIDKYKDIHGLKKFYLAFALSDETYSLVASNDFENRGTYFCISLFNQLSWVAGCTVGAFLGQNLPFSTEGVDFVLTALFIEIFTEQWVKNRDHFPALTGLLGSLACLLIFGPELFLIPSMITIAAVLMLRYRRESS